jgi:predicted dehydrogenase
MADNIRTGVIGVGNFGARHAEKYATRPSSRFVAVADTDEGRARHIADRFGVRPVTDFRDLIDLVEAVSVAVPTAQHYSVARKCLESGIHTLVEKPISDRPEHGYALSELAESNGVVLQVGHIERFSPTFEALRTIVEKPMYIESNRISIFTGRGADVNVILDMMIHDIELIMALVDSPVESVDAVGAPVVSKHEDIANTRMMFENGCVANITASRISHKVERSMRIFQPSEYTIADMHNHKIIRFLERSGNKSGEPLCVDRMEQPIEQWDSLEREIDSFLTAIADGSAPRVSGRHASDAVRAATMIEESLRAHREKAGFR